MSTSPSDPVWGGFRIDGSGDSEEITGLGVWTAGSRALLELELLEISDRSRGVDVREDREVEVGEEFRVEKEGGWQADKFEGDLSNGTM